jgi:hypothetical protein
MSIQPIQQLVHISPMVSVMVGKFSPPDEIPTAIGKGVPEVRRVANPTKGRNSLALQCRQGMPDACGIQQPVPAVRNFQTDRVGCQALNPLAKLRSLRATDHVAAGQSHDIGTGDSRYGFSKRATGKHTIKAERFECINKYNVQVASQSPMLKTIIQQDDLARILLDCRLGRRDTIWILHVWYLR